MTNNQLKLFSGSIYYPHGGYEDFKGYFKNIESATAFLMKKYNDELDFTWAHLVINDTIVFEANFDGNNIKWVNKENE